jgi:hypothetical protein
LEVASDRLLKLIAKGVSVEQVAQVTDNFNRAGIMVHAYLMYGFPTQTAQETVDSLEVVRQMFELNVLQSAFWHRFAMTAHSPVGLNPEQFKVRILTEGVGTFANNDLEHEDPTGADHDQFSEGLKKSLFNYMHGVGFDLPLQEWFGHKIPKTSVKPDLIVSYLAKEENRSIRAEHALVWVGGPVVFDVETLVLSIEAKRETVRFECDELEGKWLETALNAMSASRGEPFTLQTLKQHFDAFGMDDFDLFWEDGLVDELRELGLLMI